MIDEFAPLVDAMLRAEVLMKAAVIHERWVAEYGFTGNYQRVKLYVQEARPRVAEELGITPKELAGMHHRFEVIPGAQAQVDWGDEGKILAHMGIGKVYSFHMTLSYSRDPFCCFTTSQDLETFFDFVVRIEHDVGRPLISLTALTGRRPSPWRLPSEPVLQSPARKGHRFQVSFR